MLKTGIRYNFNQPRDMLCSRLKLNTTQKTSDPN